MRIWTIAAVASLALSSFAAENVAPTKSELEDMYNKAFRAFDTNDFPQALKELDAIDARQPDLAASQNLRGVILMRQGIYDKAEAALREAMRIDPKFWNARFNLAEIPFLKKDWAEARNRFQQLLSSSQSDLAGEAKQLIQYKILLTYLLEGKENMVDSILAKLELSPDTPAVDYVKAAVAFQHKNEKEAKDWMAVAEKNFSPQLNKLFAESLYEAGWLQKPAGEARPSLPLMTAAERSEKTKAVARSKSEQAQQALRQRDFANALKFVDEADKAEANQAATLNLRGEILMEQKQFDEAEAAFKKAARLDPKFREAQYNLAQIPFKKKDYAKARERFEALFERTPGGDRNQAAQLIKFKIYMTLLLEGKESRAQGMMDQFQFTGDTPALYYAQAAWEFKHNNSEKATDWIASAKKIYSAPLNNVFADAFYDVGWMQSPEVAAGASAFDASTAVVSQAEGSPAIEPSPIPDSIMAASKQAETSKGESIASSAPAARLPITGTEAASPGTTAEQPPVSSPGELTATGTTVQPAPNVSGEAAAASEPSASAESTPAAVSSTKETVAASGSSGQMEKPAAGQTKPSGPTVLATTPATIRGTSRQTWLVGGLLLAGIFLLAWVIVPELRRYVFNIPNFRQMSVAKSRTLESSAAVPEKRNAPGGGLFGGPRQVSLRLTASKPSLRRSTTLASPTSGGALTRLADFGEEAKVSQASAYHKTEPDREFAPVAEPLFESVGSVIEQDAEIARPTVPQVSAVEVPAFSGPTELQPDHELAPVAEALFESVGPVIEQEAEIARPTVPQTPELAELSASGEVSEISAIPAEEPTEVSEAAEEAALPGMSKSVEPEIRPIQEWEPEPDEITSSPIQSPLAETIAEPVSDFPRAISPEPVFPQTTTPATMPETNQIPTAPVSKPPTTAVAKPQPVTTQTSVQLTFSFEIAAMQLTPSFKMGALKVRPTSKLVTMRLASPQQLQSALNLQVGFEVTKVQPAGGSLGTIRMIPSQQQRPATAGSPSLAVTGLQVVPNFEAAPVQLTPSQPGQATVFVTVGCQISTIEFSPSLEIASINLSSNSKQVFVQLPGTGPGAGEGAPVFEIADVQITEGGDIDMMQLNLLGQTRA